MTYAIGIDIGGTRAKAVAVAEDGTIVAERRAATGGAAAEWADGITRLIAALEELAGMPAAWLGVASPGLPAADGLSIASVHGPLAGLRDLRWSDLLGVDRPVPVLNDGHAALLGETWLGAAAGCRDALMLTLGTGVGGAILADGRLVRGHLGRAGHVGHICLDPDGRLDTTGLPGSLEDAIGDRTVAARSGGRYRTTAELVERHLAGDAEASRVWLRSIFVLACAVSSLVNVLDPEAVIVGGGIARAGAALFAPLAEELARLEWRPYDRGVRVVPAALGELAGALGAARHAMGL